jgi:hypothetical protein
MDAEEIVKTCCESSSAGNCAEVFPMTCAHGCAKVLVPYMDDCGDMLSVVPDETFESFHLSALPVYVDSCRQTLILWSRASDAGSCVASGEVAPQGGEGVLVSRVDAVSNACCEQDGEDPGLTFNTFSSLQLQLTKSYYTSKLVWLKPLLSDTIVAIRCSFHPRN